MKGGPVGGNRDCLVPKVTCLGMAPRDGRVTLIACGEATTVVTGVVTTGAEAATVGVGTTNVV